MAVTAMPQAPGGPGQGDRSLDQLRASYAWARVTRKDVDDKYRNLAKGAPALIMANGLMQVLAFYQSKGEAHHQRLGEDIRRWLGQRLPDFPDGGDFNETMTALLKADSATFMLATEETLEILRWIRQFASAV